MFAINQRLGAADPIPATLESLPQLINNTGLLEALRIFKVRILCTGALTICPYEHWSYAPVSACAHYSLRHTLPVVPNLQVLQQLSAPDNAPRFGCPLYSYRFVSGQCMLDISGSNTFKVCACPTGGQPEPVQ